MSLSNELSCEAGTFSRCSLNPHRCFQWFEALFPQAGTLVGCSLCCRVHQLLPCQPGAALPALVLQPPACHKSFPPGCPSPPLLPYSSDFHTVRFSVSSICFLFLNCFCPFSCAKRHRGGTVCLPTHPSILARSL